MRILQRVSAWVGWAAMLAAGVLLILEATGAIDGDWRTDIARAAAGSLSPPCPRGPSRLIGVLVGLVALVVLVAQFVPARMTRRVTVAETSCGGLHHRERSRHPAGGGPTSARDRWHHRCRAVWPTEGACPMRARLAPSADAGQVTRRPAPPWTRPSGRTSVCPLGRSTSPWSTDPNARCQPSRSRHEPRNHRSSHRNRPCRHLAVAGVARRAVVGLFGLIGFGVGWVSEHPEGLIALLRRLER